VVAPAAGLLVGGIIAVFGAELIAGAPGVMAGAPGLKTVPLPCGGIAVELLPGVIAVRGAPGAGATPEPACAYIVVEFGAVKSVPLYAGVEKRPELSPCASKKFAAPTVTKPASANPINFFINPFVNSELFSLTRSYTCK